MFRFKNKSKVRTYDANQIKGESEIQKDSRPNLSFPYEKYEDGDEYDDDSSSIATMDSTDYSQATSATTARASSKLPKLSTKVRFDKVIIRDYSITVGDNPCCSYGAPISLSWDYDYVHEVISVDEYESYRAHERYGKPMRLNVQTRHSMLLNCNVSVNEIREAIENCQLIQEQRKETVKSLEDRIAPRMKNPFLQMIVNLLYT